MIPSFIYVYLLLVITSGRFWREESAFLIAGKKADPSLRS